MGLHQAFPDAEIVGVDIRPQPRYPFTFVQGDALEFDLGGFDFVWASPPCQEYTSLRSCHSYLHYPDLIAPMRAKLEAWGGPWIMENVVGAPLAYSAELCGAVFGLRTYRHRRFEAPFMLLALPHLRHIVPTNRKKQRQKAYWDQGGFVTVAGDVGTYVGPEAMGIDWMNGNELCQAVPPAYSRYLAQFIPLPAERVA